MATSTSKASSDEDKQSPRRPLWRKLLRASLLFALILAVTLTLSIWALWSNRERVLRAATERLPSPFRVDIEDITFHSPTHLLFKGIQLHDKEGGLLTVVAEEAEWNLDAQGLLKGHLGSLRLQSPTIHVAAPPAQAESEGKSAAGVEEPSPAPDSKSVPSFSWDSLQIDDGTLKIDPAPGRPGLRAKVTALGGAFAMSEAKVSGERQTLSLSEVQLELPIPGLTQREQINIPALETSFTPSPEGDELIIEGLNIADVTISPTRETLAALFPKNSEAAPNNRLETETTPDAQHSSWLAGLPTLSLQDIALQSIHLDLQGLADTVGLPAYADQIKTDLHWKGKQLRLSEENTLWGEHEISLKNFQVADPQNLKTLGFASGSATLHNKAETGQLEISAEIDSPSVALELAQLLRKSTATSPQEEVTAQPPTTQSPPKIILKKLQLKEIDLQLLGGTHPEDTQRLLPTLVAAGSLTIRDIPLGQGAAPLAASSQQDLQLSKLEIHSPLPPEEGQEHPARPIAVTGLKANFSPRELTQETFIRKLEATSLDLEFTEAAAGWLLNKTSRDATSGSEPEGIAEGTAVPLHERLRFGELKVSEGKFQTAGVFPNIPDIQTSFTISGESQEQVDLHLNGLRVWNPKEGGHPFTSARKIDLVLKPKTLWEEHRIAALKIDGGTLIVGDELRALVGGDDAPEKKSTSDSTAETKPWSVDHVAIDDTKIILEDIAKGLPPIPIVLRTEVDNLPLSASALAGNFEPQRIELAELLIPSLHRGTSVPVLKLDTVFVEFTFDGLLRQEIESVEVVSPKIYVGEDLFWYIRDYRAEDDQAAESKKNIAEAKIEVDPTAEAAATPSPELANGEAEADATAGGWTVKKIAAYGGKMILSPRGVPLEKLSSPFPFSTFTDMENGTLDAKLKIPKDNYPAPGIDVMLIGLSGEVEFSMPIKGIDNNLVETLWVDSIRFKQFETGKAFLSLTYDAYGVYGQFGGDIYGGYLNGGFNVYMNKEYTWDCWAAATGIEAGPVTKALTPEVFLADGITDWEVVANGNIKELFQANGKFKSQTPGSINILKFDELVSEIPEGWGSLQKGLSELGMKALRDFAYDEGEGNFRIMGREGELDFLFVGPDGRRKVDLKVYDHRHPETKPRDTVAARKPLETAPAE